MIINNVRKDIPGNFFGSYLIGQEEIQEVREVLEEKSIFRYYGLNVLGKTDKFENQLKEYFKVKYSLGTSSGTASLKCALKALGVKRGDEVIVPAYGFIATAGAVVACNAIPVFCDVDKSLSLDPYQLVERITNKTRAIIPVHIMGLAANMSKIKEIGNNYSIPIIEDTAQSFGGTYKGEKLGTIGDIGCFSFQANKILSTGEGGAIVTNNNHYYQKALVYHDQGGIRVNGGFPTWDSEGATFGENYRMSEISAAIGNVQLRKIPEMLSKMKNNRKKLNNLLASNLTSIEFRQSWDFEGECGISECFYVENEGVRNELIEELKHSGINAHGYYNAATYENKMVRKHIETIYPCLNAEKLSKRAIWLTLNPGYKDEDINYIAEKTISLVNKLV
ncbi:DegT/DnrJ/EryC1/StrS family aminotransferase [Priestia megaterium]|uniref:DegT/DnrJ/EryC1/StrS family aminotransferase n=1 Tax=Priestia megaterium TaxID=1404 RepID=UPI0018A04F9C|nr:DegT/DnrJ/EryC1/StrS family aminotransferase [Priestia megaterium]